MFKSQPQCIMGRQLTALMDGRDRARTKRRQDHLASLCVCVSDKTRVCACMNKCVYVYLCMLVNLLGCLLLCVCSCACVCVSLYVCTRSTIGSSKATPRAGSPVPDQTAASRSGLPLLSEAPSLPEQDALLIRADSYRSISSSQGPQALPCRRLHRKGDGDRPICGLCGDWLIGDALMSL